MMSTFQEHVNTQAAAGAASGVSAGGPAGRFDLAAEVTGRIVRELESLGPDTHWRCPWHKAGALPVNGFTGKAYTGTNTLLFWLEAQRHGYASHRWLTFAQMRQLGGRLSDETLARPKGRRDCLGIRYGTFEKKVPAWVDPDGHTRDTETVPYAKAFRVFNLDQIVGLPDWLYAPRAAEYGGSTRQRIRDFVVTAGVNLRHGGDEAWYHPPSDQVAMPFLSRFVERSGDAGPEHYDATLLHEIVHWSGGPGRLERPDLTDPSPNAVAREELCAEFGAAILCAYFGVTGRLQHPEYIGHWLARLRSDSRALFAATRQARLAFGFLLERGGLPSPDEPPAPECAAAQPAWKREG
jgi:antirestriction protein ArdC